MLVHWLIFHQPVIFNMKNKNLPGLPLPCHVCQKRAYPPILIEIDLFAFHGLSSLYQFGERYGLQPVKNHFRNFLPNEAGGADVDALADLDILTTLYQTGTIFQQSNNLIKISNILLPL